MVTMKYPALATAASFLCLALAPVNAEAQNYLNNRTAHSLPSAIAAASPSESTAPARLVNLDTTTLAERDRLGACLDFRFIQSPEDLTFTSFGLRYGLRDHIEVGLRGVTSGAKSFALPSGGAILHGGDDLELFVRCSQRSGGSLSLAALVGVAFPGTPAQNAAVMTIGASGDYRANDRLTLVVNPRASLQDGNAIVGIGLGAHVHLAGGASLIGDWTGIVGGENTRSVLTGARKKRDIWGAALHVTTVSEGVEYALDLGYGNGTGSTTGFSLTPGLGNAAGFYVALVARR